MEMLLAVFMVLKALFWGIVYTFAYKTPRTIALSILIPAGVYGLLSASHVGNMTTAMMAIFALLLYYSIEFHFFTKVAIFALGMLVVFITSFTIIARTWNANEDAVDMDTVYPVIGQIIDQSQTDKKLNPVNSIKKFAVVGMTADAYHYGVSDAEHPELLTSPVYANPKYAKERVLLEKYKALEDKKNTELNALRQDERSDWLKTYVNKPVAYAVQEIGFCFRFAWMELAPLFLLLGGITVGLDVLLIFLL
ncbi:hypothetical protein ACKX2L_06245 [Lachnospiraceae bacterium YH-ros2228]